MIRRYRFVGGRLVPLWSAMEPRVVGSPWQRAAAVRALFSGTPR